MEKFPFSAVLLFCLVVPIIMTYRLSPGETPYWLFGIIFLLLFLNLGAGFLDREKLQDLFCWLTVILVVGSVCLSAVIVRRRISPVYQIHDMPLQLESAIQFLLQGKNPYQVTYFSTPLKEWHYSDRERNPALYHFVLPPGYLLFSLPFYFVSTLWLGFFDGRLPLFSLFWALLALSWRLLERGEKRRLFFLLLALNPANFSYFLEGRSDIFMFTFLFLGWFLLEKRYCFPAGVFLALAFATKQSSWPLFPFYLLFLYLLAKKSFGRILFYLLPFVLIFGLIVLPFFFWSPKDFLADTIFYLVGTTPFSYPISGYGWGMILREIGIIGDKFAPYPFWIWQVVFGGPLALLLFRELARQKSVKFLIFAYGLFLFVFWYFSRYFHNSHLGYLTLVFLTAYFWPGNFSKGGNEG